MFCVRRAFTAFIKFFSEHWFLIGASRAFFSYWNQAKRYSKLRLSLEINFISGYIWIICPHIHVLETFWNLVCNLTTTAEKKDEKLFPLSSLTERRNFLSDVTYYYSVDHYNKNSYLHVVKSLLDKIFKLDFFHFVEFAEVKIYFLIIIHKLCPKYLLVVFVLLNTL